MSRKPRIKAPLCIHHLISKSISELLLFKDKQDKIKYLKLLKKYKIKFNFKIYGYCLMSNHVHLHADPQGSDISKFMKGLNLSYAIYYNNKYNREGSIFRGRFTNRVVTNDSYNLILSSYIHNNPKDIHGFANKTHLYPYSSFGIYTGEFKDSLNLVDTDFILGYFSNNKKIARKLYFNFVKKSEASYKNDYEKTHYVCEDNQYINKNERFILVRDFSPSMVVSIIGKIMNVSNLNLLRSKYNHKATIFRAFCVLVMHSFCDFSYKDICKVIGNLSLGRISSLCNKALFLIQSHKLYSDFLTEILEKLKCSTLNFCN